MACTNGKGRRNEGGINGDHSLKLPINTHREGKQNDVPSNERDGQARKEDASSEREGVKGELGLSKVARNEAGDADAEVGEEVDAEETIEDVVGALRVG